MAESSILWTTNDTGDGISTGYTQAQITEWQKVINAWDTTVEGVGPNYLNKLAVTTTADARVLQVATGGAVVYGFPYFNSAVTTKALTDVAINTTGWRLVLRASWAAQTVRVTLLESADGTAAIPAATQTANTTWDLTLATGTITTADVIAITDARTYVPPFLGRQGGSATVWNTVGTANYTSAINVRFQCGAIETPIGGSVEVTFPVAFSNKPIVGATCISATSPIIAQITSASATTAEVTTYDAAGVATNAYVGWYAWGPE